MYLIEEAIPLVRPIEFDERRVIVDQVLPGLDYTYGAVRYLWVRSGRRLRRESLVDVCIFTQIYIRAHVLDVIQIKFWIKLEVLVVCVLVDPLKSIILYILDSDFILYLFVKLHHLSLVVFIISHTQHVIIVSI